MAPVVQVQSLSLATWQISTDYDSLTITPPGEKKYVLKPPSFVVAVKGLAHALVVQKKKASGKDGGNLTVKGLDVPPLFTMDVEIYDGDGEVQWAELFPMLFDINNPKSRQLSEVDHPLLRQLKFRYVLVQKVEVEQSAAMQSWKLHCQPYVNKPAESSDAQKVPVPMAPAASTMLSASSCVPAIKCAGRQTICFSV